LSQPSPSDFDRWRELILGGQTPHDAAVELGFRGSSAFRRADRERHAEVLDEWRRIRDAEKTTGVAA
jgi:AraC-like DNA-binding protein